MDYDFNKSHAWKSDPDDLFMDNVYAFRDIVNLYSHGIDFYFPNYRDAPWQVQAEISGEKINFWGFYDGDQTWYVRFMPDEYGRWQYSASFSDRAC